MSSGVVEAACKSVAGKRLKQGGMYRTAEGASAILAPRYAIESKRFDDFRERRAARRAG